MRNVIKFCLGFILPVFWPLILFGALLNHRDKDTSIGTGELTVVMTLAAGTVVLQVWWIMYVAGIVEKMVA